MHSPVGAGKKPTGFFGNRKKPRRRKRRRRRKRKRQIRRKGRKKRKKKRRDFSFSAHSARHDFFLSDEPWGQACLPRLGRRQTCRGLVPCSAFVGLLQRSNAFRSSACHSGERSDVGISDSALSVGCADSAPRGRAKAMQDRQSPRNDRCCTVKRREQAPALQRRKDGSRICSLSLSQVALLPDSSLSEGALGLAMIRNGIPLGGQWHLLRILKHVVV